MKAYSRQRQPWSVLCVGHDGFMTWKNFLLYWPFVQDIHRLPDCQQMYSFVVCWLLFLIRCEPTVELPVTLGLCHSYVFHKFATRTKLGLYLKLLNIPDLMACSGDCRWFALPFSFWVPSSQFQSVLWFFRSNTTMTSFSIWVVYHLLGLNMIHGI